MRLSSRVAALTLAVCGLTGAGGSYLVGGRVAFDGLLYDAALAARAAFAGNEESAGRSPVSVIALDSRSLGAPELVRYPRALFAPIWGQLIEALSSAGAKVIAFDLLLSYSANQFQRDFDRPFLKALARHRHRLVLGRSAGTLPARPYLGALRFDPATLGLVELAPDGDGVYRRVPMSFETADGRQPEHSLSAAVLTRAGAAQATTDVLLAPKRHLETIPTYSLIDVLRCANTAPEVLAEAFRDRIVFIGSTLPEEDRKLSSGRFLPAKAAESQRGEPCPLRPLGASAPRSRTVPGVFLHAAAVEAVLRGDLVREAPMPQRTVVAGVSALGGAAIGLGLMPWVAIALAITVGISLWAAEVGMLSQQIWMPMGPALIMFFGSIFVSYIVRYLVEDRRRRNIQHAFGHYLAPAVVDRLMTSPEALKLGGDERDITVMFADLSGFTALSTRVSAEALVTITNQYLELIVAEVDATDGYVDKFIGDAVMAIWGAPAPDLHHARHGVQAALLAATSVGREKEQAVARGDEGFGIKIGLYSGAAVVGNVGSEKRYNYTAVGETVNLAARLESMPGLYRCDIVVGPTTATVVGDEFLLREIDRVAVKGGSDPITLYEPMAELSEATDAQHGLVQRYVEALALYRARRFAEAWEAWKAQGSSDGPSAVMAERARRYVGTPPPGDWDAVFVLTGK